MTREELNEILEERPELMEKVKKFRADGKTENYIKIMIGREVGQEQCRKMMRAGMTAEEITKKLKYYPESTIRCWMKMLN